MIFDVRVGPLIALYASEIFFLFVILLEALWLYQKRLFYSTSNSVSGYKSTRFTKLSSLNIMYINRTHSGGINLIWNKYSIPT